MKKLIKTILACGLVAACAATASASPTMRLSADGGATWVTIPDNSALDADSTPGGITYFGPVGAWFVSVATGVGSPLVGTPITPLMDVGTTTISGSAQSLIVQLSDTNFIGFPNETFIARITTSTSGIVTYNSYVDPGNILFGTTSSYPSDPVGISPSPTAALLLAEGPFVNGTYLYSNSVVVPSGLGTYSLTLETTIDQEGAGRTSTDAVLFNLPPPPCNCTLTFNSPTVITNCAGDAAPAAVVASQNCGNGPVNVPVILASTATTAGCPTIITRTYTATDDCGTLHTFIQTNVVNCLPNCTINASLTTTTVGTTNLHVTVADAGAGATYQWNILDGTITAGQGTTNLTFTAGTDTNILISITVKIINGSGCESDCTASLRLTPKPPEINLGSGDTATIGFWHNKNGQALILCASNSPALGNWLGTNFNCLFGNLTGKSNSVVAALFLTDFNVTGQKTYAQVFAGALAAYFTSSNLGGGAASQKNGFNLTPGGTGARLFNVGSNGTALGLQNNTSYSVMFLLQVANSKCPFGTSGPVFDALNNIFDGINQKGDIK